MARLHVEVVAMALDAGFADVEHIASATIADRYFSGRSDGLQPSSGEELIVARSDQARP